MVHLVHNVLKELVGTLERTNVWISVVMEKELILSVMWVMYLILAVSTVKSLPTVCVSTDLIGNNVMLWVEKLEVYHQPSQYFHQK